MPDPGATSRITYSVPACLQFEDGPRQRGQGRGELPVDQLVGIEALRSHSVVLVPVGDMAVLAIQSRAGSSHRPRVVLRCRARPR